MTWNANIPLVGNQLANDWPDINENYTHLKNFLANIVNSWDSSTATNMFIAKTKRTALTNADTPYTMLATDIYMEVDASGGAVEIDLLSAATAGAGRFFIVKLTDATNALTLDPNGSETIDDNASMSITADDTAYMIVSDGTNWQILASYEGAGSLPRSYFTGLGISNGTDTDHDIDIAVGEARDSGDNVDIKLTSAMSKQIDVSWAAGGTPASPAGGLFSGTVASNTTYHLFVIRKDSDGSVDAGFDTSLTAANIPTGYTKYRYIGSVITDSSANIINFTQWGDQFLLNVPILDVDVSNLGDAESLYTLTVPTDIKVNAILNVYAVKSAATPLIWVYSPDQTSATPSVSAAPLLTIYAGATAGEAGVAPQFHVRTNTSAQIAARAEQASTTLRIATLGWIDRRGRDD